MKIYQNIMNKVPEYEYKRGIEYAKRGEKLYKRVNIFYILAFAATMFFNLAFIIGLSMSERHFSNMENALYNVVGFSVALIAALVLKCFKKSVIPLICSFVLDVGATVGLFLTFSPFSLDDAGRYLGWFYWRHLAPLALVLLLSGGLTFIAVRAEIKRKNTYKKIIENIYKEHNTSTIDGDVDDKNWDEILSKYE